MRFAYSTTFRTRIDRGGTVKICRIYRPWLSNYWHGYPQRNHHVFKDIRSMGHEVEELEITPWKTRWLYLSYLVGMLGAFRKFRNVRPSVIVTEDLESSLLAICIKLVFRTPFVFDFMDDYSRIVKHDGQSLRYLLARWLERVVPRIADCIIVADTTKMDFCLRSGIPREKLFLIPNGYDDEIFKPSGGDSALAATLGIGLHNTIVFVGKLNSYYNIEVIIKSMKLVTSIIPDAQLVLVGEGKHLLHLQALSRKLSVNHCVRFVGSYPHPDIPKIINLSDVCILPLPAASALILYEYMGCGKAVVAPRGGTDKMGIPEEMFPEDCLLKVDNSPEGFAEGIIHLLHNKDIAAKMGLKAMEMVSKYYKWNSLSGRYMKVLEKTATTVSQV